MAEFPANSISVPLIYPSVRHIQSARAPKSDSLRHQRPKSHYHNKSSGTATNRDFGTDDDDDDVDETDFRDDGTILAGSSVHVDDVRHVRNTKPRFNTWTDSSLVTSAKYKVNIPIVLPPDRTISTEPEFDSDYDFDDEDEIPPKPQQTPKQMYERMCKINNVVPCQSYMKQLNSPIVDMSKRLLGSSDVKAICVSLLTNVDVCDLDLSGNDLGSRGTNYVVEALRENTSITDLSLADTTMGLEGLKSIGNLLVEMKPLRSLDLSGNKFYQPHAEILKNVLEKNSCLQDLNLSNNSFDDEGGKLIAKALSKNTGLRKLDLSWNHLRRSGAESICKSLAHNDTLVELDLSWNGLAQEGCKALATSLPQNHCLKELDISCNRIDFNCLKHLLPMMNKNGTLETLKLDKNPLSTDGAIALLMSLSQAPKSALRCLHIMDIPINGDFMDVLAELKQKRKVVVHHRDPNLKRITHLAAHPKTLKDFDPALILFEFMREENMRLIDLFRTFDTDGSYSVSRTELRDGFMVHVQTINLPLDDESLDSLFERLDKNEDEEIAFDELRLGYRKALRQLSTDVSANSAVQERQGEMIANLRQVIKKALQERRAASTNARRRASIVAMFKMVGSLARAKATIAK